METQSNGSAVAQAPQTKVGLTVAALNAMTMPQLVAQAEDKFVDLFMRIHGKDGNRIYGIEKHHFLKRIAENGALQNCDKMSLFGAFLDAAVDGLSFDPAKKHCYLVPYGKKAVRQVTGYGELELRIRRGQIKYADNPKLVYDGDVFEYGEDNGRTFLKHIRRITQGEKMIACYLKLTRMDDSLDYKVLSFQELMEIKKFSKDQNSPAWNAGLAGMFQNKTIKHAFRNYPKPTIGGFSKFQTEETEDIDYGFQSEEQEQAEQAEESPAQETAAPATEVQQNGNGQKTVNARTPSIKVANTSRVQEARVAAMADDEPQQGAGIRVPADEDNEF